MRGRLPAHVARVGCTRAAVMTIHFARIGPRNSILPWNGAAGKCGAGYRSRWISAARGAHGTACHRGSQEAAM